MALNYSLLFYLKKPKNYTGGNIPVYMRFTVEGVQKECATTRTADPERWCSRSSRENGKTEVTKSLNFHLDDLVKKVDEAHAQLVKDRKKVTAENLRDKFLGRDLGEKQPKILAIFLKHNNLMESLIGKEYEPNTLKGYKTCYGHLVSYIKSKYNLADMSELK
jgi:hypothetical protein